MNGHFKHQERPPGRVIAPPIAGRWDQRLQTLATVALAIGIFCLDVLSPLQGAVAVLYTGVILAAARGSTPRHIFGVALVCAGLAIAGYLISHDGEPLGSPMMRLSVSLVAITITALLSARHQVVAADRQIADQRYRTIFNAAGFPIWEADWSEGLVMLNARRAPDRDVVEHTARTAIIRAANQAAAELFGLAGPGALIGGTLVPFSTPEAEATLARILATLHAGASAAEEETRFITAHGAPVDVLLRITLPPHQQGWQQVLVMALDITERKQTGARLAQAQAELAHMARITTLGQLAASIAHEVNQPLSALITYARSGRRWLKREAPDAREVADCLDQIVASGTRAADVIARIRALARRADPRTEAIDLALLVNETVELLRRDLTTHDVNVALSVPEGLPLLSGDRVQIQQVVMNLLLNAEQAMTQSDQAVRQLWIEAGHDNEATTISVRDSGDGIDEADTAALFSPFFSTKEDGLGMGLSICRSIIERHGGTLTAGNHPAGGAVFTIRLPITMPQEDPA